VEANLISTKIGILGGGQLARMLCLAGSPLGLNISVFAEKATDPAAQVTSHRSFGSLEDDLALSQFVKNLDVLTFESEFVNIEKLKKVLPKSVKVFPSLDTIAAIQDRETQKQLLDRYKIPTAPWTPVHDKKDLKKAWEKFPEGFVLKQRRFGYDGYGTFIYDQKHQPSINPFEKSAHGFIAEALIRFDRELATSYVRSGQDQFVSLPLVESVQVNSRCFSVMGPVQHQRLSAMNKQFRRLMKDIAYEGILAVELFATKKGLLVNELAPRVHNSAHYTQDALEHCQFEYHWRAGLNLPLPKPQLLSKGFAMVNLLGEGEKTKLSYAPVGQLHWYGKTDNRPGRKMGHINVLGSSPKAALKTALKWRKEFSP
jgi:5-(carboxyamino)imidazole ribonucleotide synthase